MCLYGAEVFTCFCVIKTYRRCPASNRDSYSPQECPNLTTAEQRSLDVTCMTCLLEERAQEHAQDAQEQCWRRSSISWQAFSNSSIYRKAGYQEPREGKMEEPRSQDQQLLDSFEIHLYLVSSLLIQLLISNEAEKNTKKTWSYFILFLSNSEPQN